MKQHQSSRIINETKLGAFGLGVNDFMIIVFTYGFLQLILSGLLKLSPLIPLICMFLFSIFLIIIRQNFRKNIIRDYLKYVFNQFFYLGLYYDKVHRKK